MLDNNNSQLDVLFYQLILKLIEIYEQRKSGQSNLLGFANRYDEAVPPVHSIEASPRGMFDE